VCQGDGTMTRSVRNSAAKAQTRRKRSAATEQPAAKPPRKRRPAVLLTTDVLRCLSEAQQRTRPLVARFGRLQLAFALSVLASRHLRHARERGECTPQYRDEICRQFADNARSADAGRKEPRVHRKNGHKPSHL
jgi:hypothetical protein